VIAKAQELDAVLISLDNDFADIVAYPPAKFKGIIAIQMRNHPEATRALLSGMLRYLSLHPENDHYQGMLVVVEPGRTRIRH
jgi:predicted nuclease of predicted toxin-antitoxin system